MRALLISLPLVLALSVIAHAEDYSARADQNGAVEVQAMDGSWYPLVDLRTRAKGGVVHVPPGIEPFESDALELKEISYSYGGYRYFVLHIK